MKHGIHIIAVFALMAWVVCGYYAANSYFTARHLKARAETMSVRTRLMKHQVGELAQKVRTLDRVQHFIDRADALRLSPENWSVYEVRIQDALAYRQLAKIIEQCAHKRDLFYKPISFHVAVGQESELPSEDGDAMAPRPLGADSMDPSATDLLLALQGSFLVRH